jgi:hypothetical protein
VCACLVGGLLLPSIKLSCRSNCTFLLGVQTFFLKHFYYFLKLIFSAFVQKIRGLQQLRSLGGVIRLPPMDVYSLSPGIRRCQSDFKKKTSHPRRPSLKNIGRFFFLYRLFGFYFVVLVFILRINWKKLERNNGFKRKGRKEFIFYLR